MELGVDDDEEQQGEDGDEGWRDEREAIGGE
jgi:hypothetical protein